MGEADTLLWFSFEDRARARWRVYLIAKLEGCDGITFFDRREIFIDATLGRADREDTLWHELKHAALATASGLTAKREERAIRALTPRLWPILRRLGLAAPALPPGFTALRRRARRAA